jgi:hypothetical protein
MHVHAHVRQLSQRTRCAFPEDRVPVVRSRGASTQQIQSAVLRRYVHISKDSAFCAPQNNCSKPPKILASRGGRSESPDEIVELGAADTSKSADRRVRASGTRQRWSRGFQNKRDLAAILTPPSETVYVQLYVGFRLYGAAQDYRPRVTDIVQQTVL